LEKINKSGELLLVQLDDLCCHSSLKKFLSAKVPLTIAAIGNIGILQNKTLAIFSSSQYPGKVILQTYDLIKNIREAGITVIGGFHSLMEGEGLHILLMGKHPLSFTRLLL